MVNEKSLTKALIPWGDGSGGVGPLDFQDW